VRGGPVVATSLLLALLGATTVTLASPAADRVHIVVGGDTLDRIGRRYGVSVDALVAANHLASAHVTLRIGHRLLVPPAEPGVRRVRRLPQRAAPNLREARGPTNLVLAIPDFVDEAPHFAWPSYGPITSPFGRRRHGWHRGVDIRGQRGDPVTAAASGVVVVSGIEPRYGRVIKIEHDGGFMTVYAHNDENLVEVGDEVQAGDLIGRIGRTGRATAEHVHFEIRRDGRVYNPLYLLPLPPEVARVDDMDADDNNDE